MIELPVLLGFIAATFALIVIPGPNVAVIVATGATHGRGSALAVVAGTTIAQAAQIALVVLGLTALLETYSWAFTLVKWLGIFYLIYLGVSAFLAKTSREQAKPVAGKLFLRGAATALANPKTMVFHAAFLPLFVNASQAVGPQLLVLASIFLIMALVLDGVYALGAGALSHVFRGNSFKRLTNKLSGAVMLSAAGWLAIRQES